MHADGGLTCAPATRRPGIVVTVPAKDEAERIEACLAALAGQRDHCGRPLGEDCFEVLVFANNCADDTAIVATALAAAMPQAVTVVEAALPQEKSNAGSARKRAMDLAAARLAARGHGGGFILTTDADSCVSPTWIAATLRAFEAGADCVAGYVDGNPLELLRLGPAFCRRGRLEDAYLRALAEIRARCDPRPHDPWPNHCVSSGASLAVTLSAYRAIGGLPEVPTGEDAALTQALERAGFRVRHAMDVTVTTSCRLDGRARGGAADTMSLRHLNPETPCDAEIEPAFHAAWRSLHRGRLRRLREEARLAGGDWAVRLGIRPADAAILVEACCGKGFEDFWRMLSEASPLLRKRIELRPSDLPKQIARAEMILEGLRRSSPILSPTTVPDDRLPVSELFASEVA